jgi:Tol biopolymer transport system component
MTMADRNRRWWLALGVTVALGAGTAAQKDASAEKQLQAAIHQEMVDGNLKGAIEAYRGIASLHGAPRALVAQALARMADCYRKLGDAQAREIYQRIVREFGDEPVAAEARERLAAMGRDVPRASSETGASRVVMDLAASGGIFGGGLVSRDGRYLPATDWTTGDLVLNDLKTGQRTRMTDTATFADLSRQQYAGSSRVSPDGRSVAFGWFNGARYDLRLLDTKASGPTTPRVLLQNEDVEYVQPFDWSPDGTRLAVQVKRKGGTGQIGLVSIADGSLTPLKSFPWSDQSIHMEFSPDGRALAYDQPSADDPGERDVYVLAVDGSREVHVSPHRRNDEMVGWSVDGARLLFVSDRTGSPQLWAQPMVGLEAKGPPRVVSAEFRSRTMGVTRDGSLFYLGTSYERSPFLTSAFDFERSVATEASADPGEEFYSINYNAGADWSPDGKWLALSRRDRGGPVGVLVSVLTADGKLARNVRPKLSQFGPLQWWPDSGSFVTGGIDVKGRGGVFRVDAHSGVATALVLGSEGEDFPYITAVAPDAATVYYRHVTPSAVRILARDVTSNTERVLLGQPRAENAPPNVLVGLSLSPDGAWIVTSTKESANGATTLRAVSTKTGEPTTLLTASAASTQVLMWAPDSQSLFVRRQLTGGTPEVLRVRLAGGEAEKIAWTLGNDTRDFRVHPDGRRLVCVRNGSGGRAELRALAGVAR